MLSLRRALEDLFSENFDLSCAQFIFAVAYCWLRRDGSPGSLEFPEIQNKTRQNLNKSEFA